VARPKGLSGDARRLAILDAAEAEFGRRGLNAGLADIGGAVGISRPSVLHHFGTKEGLYAAVVERLFKDMTRDFGHVMLSSGTFSERLVALFERYIAFVRGRPAFARIVLREIVDGQGPARDLLRDQLVPLLDLVEGFLSANRSGVVPQDLPVRAVILQLGANELLRTAAGDLEEPLWRDAPGTRALLQRYFALDPLLL
jgi:AcrR family transcriptional regulator